ncbi:non-homologous end-joining DNA ligase [Amycolatopsis aidingensis]|uniref:non-homologous end-joining DNA ligase n=1 Tax=Amycolatopsis aidingensis TaxID=2842453 RepID=UPI001C0DE8E3|nr:non-homologous end-joining DNA ligase [Amycolatopsis aidingensis]
MPEQKIAVEVDGRRLTLSNLDKVLYPAEGFTKREVLDYYRRVAPAILPHLAGRASTFLRYPDGVDGQQFYEKDVSRHAPDWVRTARLVNSGSRGGSEVNHHPVIADLPTLIWAANLAALELHVPQWTVGSRGARHNPDRLVFDLDPGPPATVVECCRVADRLREVLAEDGLTAYPKTSGSKGLQVYCAVRTRQPERTSEYARAVAESLASESPGEVVARMTKAVRPGKVFIDWSQNNPAKTTVAPYSLRGREHPTVSTPVTWAEVRNCTSVADLTFTAAEVPDRVDRLGDLFGGLTGQRMTLPRSR